VTLKEIFDINVEAMLVFYDSNDEMIIAAECDVGEDTITKTIEEINKNSKSNIKRESINIFTQKSKTGKACPENRRRDTKILELCD